MAEKGILIMRHLDWMTWCRGKGASERMGGTCLLHYYFTLSTILFFFLTMDRYPFVDLAYYEA